MSNSVTSCNIKNEVDDKIMTLNVEWDDNDVKILIMRHGELPVRGQVTVAKLVEAAENFNKTKPEYLEDIKEELCGRNLEIQFFLKENLFMWKKKIWTRGKIICQTLLDTVELSNLLIDFVGKNCANQKALTSTEKENKKLKKKLEKMEKSMDKMVKIKNSIEDELLRRFLILLNSKKNRIRALRDQLQEYKKDSIFEKSTDESDVECIDVDSQPSKRIKVDTISNECDEASTQFINSTNGLSIFNNITRAIEDTHESDDSFELKFEETQNHTKNNLNIVDEDPEEDIFSS
ncbi:hypothetical protein PV325_012328 [Microctonus aethiopoides]|uniref:XRCC4 coiled-coil domain-containing protein n=1 Tax=Microctonus aethiopoides TaxID=144406 RepID=A0AA39F829_9HYME|nr:hypothetical protein PV325_012328 [Microctonus aethiopoides]KAK0098070.1 hypothetical protein PV326_011479 [Microctonus aethiopoides]KAK0164566.1 hypothetical protein PV328_003181 [Microctonus aethiopoides]